MRGRHQQHYRRGAGWEVEVGQRGGGEMVVEGAYDQNILRTCRKLSKKNLRQFFPQKLYKYIVHMPSSKNNRQDDQHGIVQVLYKGNKDSKIIYIHSQLQLILMIIKLFTRALCILNC